MVLTDPTRVAATQAYLHGFRGVWIFMTAIAGSAIVVSLVIRKFDMDKILVSKFTARKS
jgi:hypothetical protein